MYGWCTAICIDGEKVVYVRYFHVSDTKPEMLYIKSLNRNIKVIACLTREEEEAMRAYINGNAEEII